MTNTNENTKNTMETLTIVGTITTTSNKQNADYKSDDPKKTAYIKVFDDKNRQKLIDFGLNEYGTDEKYFCVKLPNKIKQFFDLSNVAVDLETDLSKPNFKITNEEPIQIALLKGSKAGNTYYRLTAILCHDGVGIENLEMQNPFSE